MNSRNKIEDKEAMLKSYAGEKNSTNNEKNAVKLISAESSVCWPTVFLQDPFLMSGGVIV